MFSRSFSNRAATTVPSEPPSVNTAILAPACRGAEPLASATVTSVNGSPRLQPFGDRPPEFRIRHTSFRF